ncbi:aminoglycoside phosphotransferase family protein [Actinoplanes sp. NPDC051411]|uniref:aminoglycoside phosphotransferase family protein n=1 Tax=Actinoplanes sp. NPDC051411 TaxID=3155522 RepID=UPI003449A43A
MEPRIVVPQAFLDMPRWWHEGADWLAALPDTAAAACRRWGLRLDGEPAHGSNALVLPVRRGDERLALRLTPPGQEVSDQVAALRFWDGRGTVRLEAADLAAGAMLLERLAMGGSLRALPIDEALAVLGEMMRRLAVPAPESVPSTTEIVESRAAALSADWERLGRPFDKAFLSLALEAAARLTEPGGDLAVDGDLHSGQVLRGTREQWLTVDPVLLRGDISYDLGRMLWTRLDELADIRAGFDIVVATARLDVARARDWVVFRAIDYWLWCLSRGLTEDPVRCERLTRAFT